MSDIDHPAHYKAGGVEAIDVIEAWGLGFCLGNVVKYISRAGRKDPDKMLEDLQKAAWYLNREIDRLGGRKAEIPADWNCDKCKFRTRALYEGPCHSCNYGDKYEEAESK